jgi:hypothetical protein
LEGKENGKGKKKVFRGHDSRVTVGFGVGVVRLPSKIPSLEITEVMTVLLFAMSVKMFLRSIFEKQEGR